MAGLQKSWECLFSSGGLPGESRVGANLPNALSIHGYGGLAGNSHSSRGFICFPGTGLHSPQVAALQCDVAQGPIHVGHSPASMSPP